MKCLISIFLVVGLLYGIWGIWEVYDKKASEKFERQVAQRQRSDGSRLPGLDPILENSYRDAMQGGVVALGMFLERYRGTAYLLDPRLAWIEIDYALLLRTKDPEEARQVFQRVKARSKAGHAMIVERINDLESSF